MGRARKSKPKGRNEAREVEPAPLPDAGWTWAAAAAVCVVALLAYALTLAPTATLVDSGELILAARGPARRAPAGLSSLVALAHVATRVPAGNVAQRVNAFSAAAAPRWRPPRWSW